jgi:ferritin-like metal-binding protein YciE
MPDPGRIPGVFFSPNSLFSSDNRKNPSGARPVLRKIHPPEAMRIVPLSDLFAEQLADLQHAETRVLQRLEDAMETCPPTDLRNVLLRCISETERYQRRLATIARDYPVVPRGHDRRPRRGEAVRVGGSHQNRLTAFAGGVPRISFQRSNRSEIPGYFFARHYARRLGDARAAELLTRTIEEKHGTKHILKMVARGRIDLEDVVAA